MKNLWMKALLGTAVLSVAASAWAFTEQEISIGKLRATNTNPAGYWVFKTSGNFVQEGTCQTDFAEPSINAQAAHLELMNKTLLSAFLAGKSVRLWISGTCGANNRVSYYRVELNSAL